jgi:hypothetical protein
MYGPIVLLLDCGGEIKDNGDRLAIPKWQKHCGSGFGRRSKWIVDVKSLSTTSKKKYNQ